MNICMGEDLKYEEMSRQTFAWTDKCDMKIRAYQEIQIQKCAVEDLQTKKCETWACQVEDLLDFLPEKGSDVELKRERTVKKGRIE